MILTLNIIKKSLKLVKEDLEMLKSGEWDPDKESVQASIDNIDLALKDINTLKVQTIMTGILQIKSFLDTRYFFDVLTKRRKKEIVMARKVFVVLCLKYGYSHKQIREKTWVTHTMCIHNSNTFDQIRPIDLEIYNECIDFFNLPIQKYSSVNGIFKPFIDNLELERKIIKNV